MCAHLSKKTKLAPCSNELLYEKEGDWIGINFFIKSCFKSSELSQRNNISLKPHFTIWFLHVFRLVYCADSSGKTGK